MIQVATGMLIQRHTRKITPLALIVKGTSLSLNETDEMSARWARRESLETRGDCLERCKQHIPCNRNGDTDEVVPLGLLRRRSEMHVM